jgi:hypothetical protein
MKHFEYPTPIYEGQKLTQIPCDVCGRKHQWAIAETITTERHPEPFLSWTIHSPCLDAQMKRVASIFNRMVAK